VTLAVTADLRRRFGLRDLEPTTETTMTEERMALLELVEKQADGDLVREMLAFAAERIMEAEVEVRTGAAKGARTPMREVQRNGYRDRGIPAPAGSRWRSPSCARAATARPHRRASPRWIRDPSCTNITIGPPDGGRPRERDLDKEIALAGKPLAKLAGADLPPCIYSVNVFGPEPIRGYSNPPDFFRGGAQRTEWDIPEATVCVWPYEAMYGDDVYDEAGAASINSSSQRSNGSIGTTRAACSSRSATSCPLRPRSDTTPNWGPRRGGVELEGNRLRESRCGSAAG
jgi:hypothetical protein